jgi:hypothetical protein
MEGNAEIETMPNALNYCVRRLPKCVCGGRFAASELEEPDEIIALVDIEKVREWAYLQGSFSTA